MKESLLIFTHLNPDNRASEIVTPLLVVFIIMVSVHLFFLVLRRPIRGFGRGWIRRKKIMGPKQAEKGRFINGTGAVSAPSVDIPLTPEHLKIKSASGRTNLTGREIYSHFTSGALPPLKFRSEGGMKDHLLQKIHSLLDSHIDDPRFGIEQLCRALGMSRAQLYRKFKALNDRTLHDYLRAYRLTRAKELLLATDRNVSEVAYETGFTNLSHFSRVFTEEFGKRPKDYRKRAVLSFRDN